MFSTLRFSIRSLGLCGGVAVLVGYALFANSAPAGRTTTLPRR